jgi:hypothetical protein
VKKGLFAWQTVGHEHGEECRDELLLLGGRQTEKIRV